MEEPGPYSTLTGSVIIRGLADLEHTTFLRVPVARGGVEQAASALSAFCAAHHVPVDAAWRMKVSLDEALSNVVRHGAAASDATIALRLQLDRDVLELSIADGGPAFDPLAEPAPDVAEGLEARRPGGLGIALMRALLDDLTYERRDGLNVLVLRKRLTG